MLSYSNILISGSRANYHVTNNSNGPTTSKYSFFREEECRHYSLTRRGPILKELKKGKCGNPVSVFIGLLRSPEYNPQDVVSFFETFGNFTPFNDGYYDGKILWAASRRLLCLLEIIENYKAISQTNTPETTILKQFANCIELLVNSYSYYGRISGDNFNTYDVYLQIEETNEVIITAPIVPDFMHFIFGWNFDEMHTYTPSSFELTQERIKTIDGALQNLSTANEDNRVYLQTDETLPTGDELKLFEAIKYCSRSVRFFDNNGWIAVEAGDHFISKAEIKSLQTLSSLVIDRELNYYLQPMRFDYSFERKGAVPDISCVHQMIYFSLMALEPDAVYVDCSREKCQNKTVKLFQDKVIPCCCTSCRTAAASKRNRDSKKIAQQIIQGKKTIAEVPDMLKEQVQKTLDKKRTNKNKKSGSGLM